MIAGSGKIYVTFRCKSIKLFCFPLLQQGQITMQPSQQSIALDSFPLSRQAMQCGKHFTASTTSTGSTLIVLRCVALHWDLSKLSSSKLQPFAASVTAFTLDFTLITSIAIVTAITRLTDRESLIADSASAEYCPTLQFPCVCVSVCHRRDISVFHLHNMS